MEKFKIIRTSYPVLETQVYLDTATTGLISKESYNEMRKYLDRRYTDGMDIPWYVESWARADRLRQTVADMINAQAEEIFFDKSCSSALNVISSGIDFEPGSNVVTTDLAFPSTPYTWMNQARRKLELRCVKSENGMVSLEGLMDAVDEKTIAISLCYVEYSSGFKHNLYRIGEFCSKNGILLVVDATQCIGAMEVDVKKMNIDFLAVSTYKYLNNLFGTGFGYVSRAIIDRIHPQYTGWVGTPDRMDFPKSKLEYHKGAQRYELGGLNWIGLWGMESAVNTYLELGKKDVQEHILRLTEYIYKKAEETLDIGLIGPFPEENRSGITYITFPKSWKLDDGVLHENGIRAHVASENSMRISAHFYNNSRDIDRLFEFLKTF